MKRIYIFAVALMLVAIACEKETEKVFRLDPNAKVYVKATQEVTKVKNASQHLTTLEIVKQATFLNGRNYQMSEQSGIVWTWVGKDTISAEPALLRWGTDIIYDTDGYGHYGLQTDFITSVDLVICRGAFRQYDTIAYIPNSNMTNAKTAILKALEEKDTLSVYAIFKDAFKFTPITGAEWRALKAQGLN